MNQIVLITASILGTLAIILGAFGAHALKKILEPERISSFEIGVRYQTYTALTLLVLGFNLSFEKTFEIWAFYGILWGTILFSGSIYLLSFKDFWKINLKLLGPITPIGGLFMLIGWLLLLISFFN